MPYGHCSSFFVESDDDGLYARRVEARQRREALHHQKARIIQGQLSEELSCITSDEYQDEIVDHMEVMEKETLPDVNSIDIQTEIQWYMRPYLMDFLIEAHAAFGLLEETLFLTVNLLDRYCSKRVVYKRHYQLVGCAALLIAAKYGDRKERVPTVKELKSMCCSLYEEEMFTQMEWHVLVTLNWVIGHPTTDSFLQLELAEDPADVEVQHLTWFICELALYRRDFVGVLPSLMAKCAFHLARYILQRYEVPEIQSELYGFPLFISLANLVQAERSQVLVKKYSSQQLSSASQLVEMFLMRQAQMQQRSQISATPISDHTKEHNTMPLTPQKFLGEHGNVHGYMTPPITPDGMQPTVEGYHVKHLPGHMQQTTFTLTPPSTSRRESLLRYSNEAAYLHQPTPGPYNAPVQPHLPSQAQQQSSIYGQ